MEAVKLFDALPGTIIPSHFPSLFLYFSFFLSNSLKPILGLFQLLCALDGIRLIFCPPLGHLAVGLGQCPLQLGFAFLLLFILFPQQVTVVAGGLQGVGQRVLGLWRCSHLHCTRYLNTQSP